MNREIKFRAWSKSRNKMLQPGDTTPVFWPSLRLCEYNDYGSQVTLEIMQFTGLQDASGKDIYEGDVVSSDYYYPEPEFAEITFSEGKFVADSAEQDAYLYGNLLVVGNIYENPKLLESQS